MGEVSLQVEFISSDSKWKQGIVLQTEGDFVVNKQNLPNEIVLAPCREEGKSAYR